MHTDMNSIAQQGNPDSHLVPPDLVSIMQELAIAAHEPLPMADAFYMILETIGRHSGWLFGRILATPDNSFEGLMEISWTKPGTSAPIWPDDDLRDSWVSD